MLIQFFKTKTTCKHKNVPNNVEEAYCQDCGTCVKNEWYMVRCACCGVKRKSVLKNNHIQAQTKYCQNCGNENIVVEKIDNLNFLNVPYSILIKKSYNKYFNELEQVWVEDATSNEVMLLTKKDYS